MVKNVAPLSHMLSPTAITRLENHLKKKVSNNPWVLDCLAKKLEEFPYRPTSGGRATFDNTDYTPQLKAKVIPDVPGNEKPLYLVNIPVAHLPLQDDFSRIDDLIQLFEQQSFGLTHETSEKKVKQRVAVVFGINQIYSIDPQVNRAFLDLITNVEPIHTMACRLFGFFWHPALSCSVSNCYPVEKAFLILKALNKRMANKVRVHLEGDEEGLSIFLKEQIPYAGIRERIKTSSQTVYFARKFVEEGSTSPLYYMTMDSDCIAMKKRGQTGLFSRLDQIIAEQNPSVISMGYRFSSQEGPLLKLAVRLDMLVREATNAIIPFGPYFPEPCTGYRIKAGDEPDHHLAQLSFLEGNGERLESRRMIRRGRNRELFDTAAFLFDGGFFTATPARARTENTEKVTELTAAMVREKQHLKTLRGLPQSHLFSKNWADNLYAALGHSVSRVTNATGPMMHIFGVFDPISRMYKVPGRYSENVYRAVINDYDKPLSRAAREMLDESKKKLMSLGMSKKMVNLIERAAEASGDVIRQVLAHYMD